MMKTLDPMTEDCDTCGAAAGIRCSVTAKAWPGSCSERWRRAAETRECLEEERRERRADGERSYQPHRGY